jgi:hypothetical protein
MVMRNRGEGSNAPHWWDDLPPKVRERFTQPIAPLEPEERFDARVEEPPPPISGSELVGELSRLAIVFALVALGNILFLFAALYFVHG